MDSAAGEASIVGLFAELIPTLGLGFLIGRLRPAWTRPLATPLVRFGVPVSVMGLLLKGGIHSDLAFIALFAASAIAAWMLMIQLVPRQIRLVVHPTLQIGSALGNTAYFGIPVALALLPSDALPVSIGYDLGATLLAWSLGPFWLRRGTSQDDSTVPQATAADGHRLLSELIGHLFASPASRGLIGALIVQVTPWQTEVAAALWMPSRFVISLALVVVGMRLGALEDHSDAAAIAVAITPAKTHGGDDDLRNALLSKLLLFPAWIGLLSCCLPFMPLTRQALVLQGAAPAAISVLLMAEEAGRGTTQAARLILLSTMLALVSVPLWWFVILRPLGTLGTSG